MDDKLKRLAKDIFVTYSKDGCLHPVACTRLGSGFRMTIFRRKYFQLKMVMRPKHVAVTA
jgi:hypothetical protein